MRLDDQSFQWLADRSSDPTEPVGDLNRASVDVHQRVLFLIPEHFGMNLGARNIRVFEIPFEVDVNHSLNSAILPFPNLLD